MPPEPDEPGLHDQDDHPGAAFPVEVAGQGRDGLAYMGRKSHGVRARLGLGEGAVLLHPPVLAGLCIDPRTLFCHRPAFHSVYVIVADPAGPS